jgi:hypothetical protein
MGPGKSSCGVVANSRRDGGFESGVDGAMKLSKRFKMIIVGFVGFVLTEEMFRRRKLVGDLIFPDSPIQPPLLQTSLSLNEGLSSPLILGIDVCWKNNFRSLSPRRLLE